MTQQEVKFTEHMDIRLATKNLNLSVELEEYEAAKYLKNILIS